MFCLDFSHDFYMFFMFTTIKMGSELVGRGTTEVLQSNTAEDLTQLNQRKRVLLASPMLQSLEV